MNITTSRPLRQGNDTSLSFSLPVIDKYRTAAMSDPQADRLIIADSLDQSVVSAPHTFFGSYFQWLVGDHEMTQNKQALETFKTALIERYGAKVVQFVCPTIDDKIKAHSSLSAASVKEIFEAADLVEAMFDESSECYPFLADAVQKNAAAIIASANAKHAVADWSKKAIKAEEAAIASAKARVAVEDVFDKYFPKATHIIDWLLGGDIQQADLNELEQLCGGDLGAMSALHQEYAAAKSASNLDKTTIDSFSTFVKTKNIEADRTIIDKSTGDIVSAPGSFFGRSVQLLLGWGDGEHDENRAVTAKFKEALTKKYGTTIAEFAFPRTKEIEARHNALDYRTIRNVLKKAKLAADVLEKLEKPIQTALRDSRYAKYAAIEAEGAKHDAGIAIARATEANKDVEEAFDAADQTVISFLKDTSAEGNKILLEMNDADMEIRDLWLGEAQHRYRESNGQNPYLPVARVVGNRIEAVNVRVVDYPMAQGVLLSPSRRNGAPEDYLKKNISDGNVTVVSSIPSAPPLSEGEVRPSAPPMTQAQYEDLTGTASV